MQIALLILLIFYQFNFYFSFERKLNWTLNPGCLECDDTVLLHVTATGPNDTLHHVWGFVGRPTLLLALTDHDTDLVIDWDELMLKPAADSIHFSTDPYYSFGLSISRILEFQDVNDTASLNSVPDSHILSYDTKFFNWSQQSLAVNDDGSLVLIIQASDFDNGVTTRDGNVTLTLTGYGKDGHGSQLPHLLHSANCSQLEITLNGLELSPQFEGQSRFALEFLVAGSERDAAVLTEHRSLDDEHTPGVFTVIDLLTPWTNAGELGGFIQWRPVAYTEPERNIESSTETKHYDMENSTNPQVDFNNTLLDAFYGSSLRTHLAQSLNISFGVSEDGFYNATNYVTWSLSMGYGQPPAEHLSLLVLLIMAIGLGVPLLLMLAGGIFMLIGQRRRADDELFLNR